MEDLITFSEVAKLLGLSRLHLSRAWRTMPDFPAPVSKQSGLLRYRRADILRYQSQRDVAATLQAALEQINIGEKRITQFNAAARLFITGNYLPKAQQNRLTYKKLIARQRKPKTRVETLNPDWTKADRWERKNAS